MKEQASRQPRRPPRTAKAKAAATGSASRAGGVARRHDRQKRQLPPLEGIAAAGPQMRALRRVCWLSKSGSQAE